MTAAAQRGTTTVSERAVRRIAERAAAEALSGRDRGSASGAVASVRGARAEVSLNLTLPYPTPLAGTVRSVHAQVTARTRHMTGLDVSVARLAVTSFLPTGFVPSSPATQDIPVGAGRRTPRRRWSQRRLPLALIALFAAVVCGAVAFDMVRVHIADRTAGVWRSEAVNWLSDHGPGEPAVATAGGLTALAGLWMIVLALTPGHRHQHTVHGQAPRIDTVIDRSAVASLVRDAVAGVDGVTAVRVRMRGRRVAVRAALAFGDMAAARTAVTAAARDTLTSCRLRRSPRLRVTVAPGTLWRPVPAPGTDGGGAEQGESGRAAATEVAVGEAR